MKKSILPLLALLAGLFAVTAPAYSEEWMAIATGFRTSQRVDSTSSYVSSGLGRGASVQEAERNALNRCQSATVSSCKVVTRWNEGCGFVTVGRGRYGNGRVGWGVGSTKSEATERCLSVRGIRKCQEPIGGCIVGAM